MDEQIPADTSSFYSNIAVDTQRIEACLRTIETSRIKPIAEAFETNIEQTSALADLPLILQLDAAAREIDVVCLIKAASKVKGPFASRESVLRQLLERHTEFRAEPCVAEQIVARADNRLQELVGSDHEFSSALRPLRSAVTAATWAAFEIAASDAWVAALNTDPMVLGQATLGAAGDNDVEGIAARQISVGLLARYHFDLRSSLGTILKSKYDFTSVAGIRRAFVAAFGKSCEGSLACLQSQELQVLEATRHLLVHRAGVVDSDYVRRTGSTSPIGSYLQIEPDRLSMNLNRVIQAGCELLSFVDGRLKMKSA